MNGDFFDPLAVIPLPEERRRKSRPEREFPIEVEENAAVRQFKRIVEGHPLSITALRDFLRRGKRIVFRWGNHDASILWPGVQTFLREELSPPRPAQLEFQVKPYVFDRICVDHGHQLEIANHFDESNLFIERRTRTGERILIQNLPFGSFFVMGLINRFKLRRSYINQVQPFRTYLHVAFFLDPVFFILGGVRTAYFFVKMRFITHPMRFARFRKTLLLMMEIFRRTSLEREAEKILTGPGFENLEYDTLILGHNHQATQRNFPGGKQYINTGTWIPITSLNMSTLGHRILRTYALVEYLDGKPRASLKIWNGQPQVTEDFA